MSESGKGCDGDGDDQKGEGFSCGVITSGPCIALQFSATLVTSGRKGQTEIVHMADVWLG